MAPWVVGVFAGTVLVCLALVVAALRLSQFQSELRRLAQAQDGLRLDVQRGREASLVGLSAATQALQGQIGHTQRALAEVKALEQGRTRQLDYATDALRRLEAVVAGSSTRGAAGESILARTLGQLPPDLLAHDVAFGSRVVEYALRLPDGRYLPIDSKWTSVASLEALELADEPGERRRLQEQVVRDLRARLREMSRYLDPERTLNLAVLAVPDAVYSAAPEVRGEGWREGVLVVPYSMALPFVLVVYRLTLRFSSAVDTDDLLARLHAVAESLHHIEEEVEGRLSRGLVQVQNARDALRGHASEARGATDRLLRTAEAEAETALSAPVALARADD